jgi:hypothetical protein
MYTVMHYINAGPRRPEAPLVNLSRTLYVPGFLHHSYSLFVIRKMGFYHTKWNGVLHRTLVLRHILTTKALQNDPRNIKYHCM